MNREIQRTLERCLPQHVLDFLNEKFQQREESLMRVKELEKKVDELLTEIMHRDKTLWDSFRSLNLQSQSQQWQQSQGGGQGGNYYPVGFNYPFRPTYPDQYPMRPYMRRGGDALRDERGRDTRGYFSYTAGGQGGGGSSGGGGGGQGGGGSSGGGSGGGGSSGGSSADYHYSDPYDPSTQEQANRPG